MSSNFKKCSCYHEVIWTNNRGEVIKKKAECWGTKEKEYCSCKGDRRNCDYYDKKGVSNER